jgi:hypothetical protein
VAFPNQTQLPNEVRIFERRAPGKRILLTYPKPYNLLWRHLETIRKLRRKRQTWAAIALHLKESHGVETTAETVFKFFKRAAIGRVPIGFTDVTISTVVRSKPDASVRPEMPFIEQPRFSNWIRTAGDRNPAPEKKSAPSLHPPLYNSYC